MATTPPKPIEATPFNDDNIDELNTMENLEDDKPVSLNTGEEFESLEDLFGDGSENIKIEIYRVEPKVFKGEDVAGYVGLLQEGDDIELLRQKFGGGKYRLQQKVNNRFADQILISIAGNPRTELTPFSVRGENREQSAAAPTVVDSDFSMNGVPIGGSMAEFEASLQRIAMIKSIFPPDINTALLGLIMDKQQTATENPNGSMIDQLKSFAEVMTMMKPEATTATGGTTIYDLGGQALQAFTKFLEVSAPGNAKMNVGQPVPGQKVIEKPEQQPTLQIQPNGGGTETITEVSAEASPENGIESDKVAAMNVNEIAEKAGSYIVAGFIQEPQQTPQETADVLKIALPPIPPSVMKQITMFKTPIFNMSKSILANQVELEPEETEKFTLFYDKVFSIFVEADDKPDQKGASID